jgi:hypothetical protein
MTYIRKPEATFTMDWGVALERRTPLSGVKIGTASAEAGRNGRRSARNPLRSGLTWRYL